LREIDIGRAGQATARGTQMMVSLLERMKKAIALRIGFGQGRSDAQFDGGRGTGQVRHMVRCRGRNDSAAQSVGDFRKSDPR